MVTLKRILGAPTVFLVGMGVAIGSGIFRTPGLVAQELHAPWLILSVWLLGGVVVLMQGMVIAELATRFPRAGGEYVYLREAYGEFPAFFFGWAYTIFIIGGGAASIAAAFGDFTCELLGAEQQWSGSFGAGAIALVVAVNALGLRVGAGFQNVLTSAKILALLIVVVLGLTLGAEPISFAAGGPVAGGPDATSNGSALATVFGWLAVLSAGFLPVLWCYQGTTDSAMLAEEIKDVRRALPRALIGSAAALTLVYLLVNLACMRVIPVNEMGGLVSVPGEAMGRLFGPAGRIAMLIVAMLVCLSAISAAVLSTIRVTFALARDGLAFRFLSGMSRGQAPVPALVVVGVFAIILVLKRSFGEVLQIYFFAAAILFGLAYASLIVFRLREKAIPEAAYRCPAGAFQAFLLILLQLAIAVGIIKSNPMDAVYTTILLAVVGLLYFGWKRAARP